MDQIKRIKAMDRSMRRARRALDALSRGLAAYRKAAPELQALDAYLQSGDWRADYEADEAGLLPPELPRGVLSQDGLYDLLEENDELLRQLAEEFGGSKAAE